MALTRVFQSGNSQAVRLPKEFRFEVEEVEILRRGHEVVIRLPPPQGAASVFDALCALPADVVRDDAPPQEREAL